MEKKITYNQAIVISNIANAIPLADGDRKLPASTAASVVMVQVGLEQIIEEYEGNCQSALKKLKKQGFDERNAAIEEMERVDALVKAHEEWNGEGDEPQMPTEEQIEKAEETRKTKDEFATEKEELLDKYRAAREKEVVKQAQRTMPQLTRAELADIIDMLGTDGKITVTMFGPEGLKPQEISRMSFIATVAAHFVGR